MAPQRCDPGSKGGFFNGKHAPNRDALAGADRNALLTDKMGDGGTLPDGHVGARIADVFKSTLSKFTTQESCLATTLQIVISGAREAGVKNSQEFRNAASEFFGACRDQNKPASGRPSLFQKFQNVLAIGK